MFVDDLGYADLSSYGSTTIETPNLDRLADEGVRFTQFYAGNGVCTPSRASMLTGRAGSRQILDGTNWVYYPDDVTGMSPSQITIAEVLGAADYKSALFGKWHLGHAPAYLPTAQGFDYYWGVPYSSDMSPLPIYENDAVVEEDISLDRVGTLTQEYTERIISYMQTATSEERPFFIYYASNFPHVPLAWSEMFDGVSPSCESLGVDRACGQYADVVRELDYSAGAIIDEVERLGIADNTVFVFTSDNGPWLTRGIDGGSAGPLRSGKGSTFDGGSRVPAIVWAPGRVQAGRVENAPALMLDWLPTFAAMAGVATPNDRAYDGFDLGPLLAGNGVRDPSGVPFRHIFYRGDNSTPGAYLEGNYKYKAAVTGGEGSNSYSHGELLFDLDADPGEQNDLSAADPARLAEMRSKMLAYDAELKADPLR
jgi:arylsulfatase A-like enzyme